MRHFLTGPVDHACRLHKAGLLADPICPLCRLAPETAKHVLWECARWKHIRDMFLFLIHFSLKGAIWPACFLHCGCIDDTENYCFDLLNEKDITYDVYLFSKYTHSTYLQILLYRFQINQVFSFVCKFCFI